MTRNIQVSLKMIPPIVRSRMRLLQSLWQDAASQPIPPQFDKWLAAKFRSLPKLGKRDRRWQADMAFACMRHAYFAAFCDAQMEGALPADHGLAVRELTAATPRPDLAWEMARMVPVERSVRWVAARVLVDNLAPLPDGLSELQNEYAREIDVVRTALLALEADGSLEAACIAQGIPSCVAPFLAARAARDSAFAPRAFLAAQARRAPLWLRVTDPARRDAIVHELRADYDEVSIADQAAIRVRGKLGIHQHAAYKEGRLEIQDLASQMLGGAVDVQPGQLVWDPCAGGGGKTVQIAAALKGRGAVYASDVRAWKLEEVLKRATRSGFTNVRPLGWNGKAKTDFPKEVMRRGGFDRVLVDAPCTASGTWRRNPDARFRLSPQAIADLTATQAAILPDVAPAVAPGGRLIYATCSFLVDENEKVVEQFAAAHGWRIVSQGVVGAPALDADTMFVAVMERIK